MGPLGEIDVEYKTSPMSTFTPWVRRRPRSFRRRNDIGGCYLHQPRCHAQELTKKDHDGTVETESVRVENHRNIRCVRSRSERRGFKKSNRDGGWSPYHRTATRAMLCSILFALRWDVCGGSVAEGFTLHVGTCNETSAGTMDVLNVSFCAGATSTCIPGQPNAYNLDAELGAPGSTATFNVPIDYEPTTMSIFKGKHDAWCLESLRLDDGPNVLGRGGRVYLDGDKGDAGCQYGVHVQQHSGRFYPCALSWTFFNLERQKSYRYEIAMKACDEVSPTAKLFLCSEPACDTAVADVGETVLAPVARGRWETTEIALDFNPSSMKVVNTDSSTPWCAEEVIFNGFKLLAYNVERLQLGPGEEKEFYNLQFNGLYEGSTRSSDGESSGQSFWAAVAEILIAVTATSVVAVALTRLACRSDVVRRSLQSRGLHHPGDDTEEREALTENSMSASGQRNNGDSKPGDTAAVASGRNSVRAIEMWSTRGVPQSAGSTEETRGQRRGSERSGDLRRHRSEDRLLGHSSSSTFPRGKNERVWNRVGSDQVFQSRRMIHAVLNPRGENSQTNPGHTAANDSQPTLYPV